MNATYVIFGTCGKTHSIDHMVKGQKLASSFQTKNKSVDCNVCNKNMSERKFIHLFVYVVNQESPF